MNEMVLYLQDIRASGRETSTIGVGQLEECFRELLPPNFSESELGSLTGLVEAFSIANVDAIHVV